ncbi:MAG: hypothetical protein NTU95_01970 [Methanothrix sp.]|nr:hypothetical protein [Methanothrix sp.]
MSISSGPNITESDRMKILLGKARQYKLSQLKEYRLSDQEENELRSLVTKRVSFLKDANMDAIIDNGLSLVGADSIIGRLEKKDGQRIANV